MRGFDNYVPEPNTGCWLWLGADDGHGYGCVWNPTIRKNQRAHRAMYAREIGPIPDGMTLDHLCRVRCCVNPTHLEPVPLRVNILRGNNNAAKNKRRTTCINGHPFDGFRYGKRHSQRFCHQCTRARRVAWEAKRK